MTETVTVTPTPGNDANGDPVSSGSPITLAVLEIEPGNAVIRYGAGGNLTDVEFTVYLPLRTRTGVDTYVATDTLVRTGDRIEVRGKHCVASVLTWQSQRSGRGGVTVLARSKSGKAA